jgi:hypothetical protein
VSLQVLPGGQIASTYRFELLDISHNPIGKLSAFSSSSANISNSINRTVKRQLTGLVLPPVDTESINTLTDRVRPWHIDQQGNQNPLGIFLFADATRDRRTYSSVQYTSTGSRLSTTGSLLDQLCTIDQATEKSTSYPPGYSIATALQEQMERSSAIEWTIDPSTASIRGSEWFVKPGGTSLLEVINALADLGGYYSLFFDNLGIGRLIQVPDLASADVDFAYSENSTVFANSIVESDDILQAPNRYIVINNSMTDESVSGRWDIPATSPNSIANRGFVVAKVVDAQGVESNSDATAMAKSLGQADYSTYAWATFDTVINPLHDTFNIVGWRGVKHREQAWAYDLSPEGKQRHELRRIFTEEVAT